MRLYNLPRRADLAALLVCACGAMLAGCGGGRGAAAAAAAPAAAATLPATLASVATRAATAPAASSPSTAPALAGDSARLALAAPTAGSVAYMGNVVAEQRVDLAAEVPGQVEALYVEAGDSVQAGDLLLQQDSSALEARRAQAQAALEMAAAQLALMTEAPDESDLAAARAAVDAAAAAYQRGVDGPTDEDLRAADAHLRQAQASVTQAQAAYNLVSSRNDIGALPQSAALEQATLQVEAAQAQYDKIAAGATDDQIAAAWAQLSQARALLDRLETGAHNGQIQAAEAQVRQAESALYLAQLELEKASVRAPFDGVVVTVQTTTGAQAAPGTRLLTLQSHEVKVEAAVDEARLARLSLGEAAEIRVNAYPDRVFTGAVALIAPALDPATRTVLVTVRPTGDAADLRPGMFATVTLTQP